MVTTANMIMSNVALRALMLVVIIGIVNSQDCRTNRAGYSYMGNISTTTNGCSCRPWTDSINTRYLDATFPDGSRAAAGSRCRNPGAETDRPWCYIVTSSCAFGSTSTFDYCDNIPVCSKTCRETPAGTEYNGAVGQTLSGGTCFSWSSIYSANFAYLFTADATIPGSVCRNIVLDATNPSSTNFVPWCLINVGGTPTPSNCSIPFCSQVNQSGCRTDLSGVSYRGNQSTSVTGRTCIRWDSASVYNAATWPVSGETITAAANYCRNPNNSPVGLWCLVSTTDWEPCIVPVCVPITGCPSPQSDSYKYKDLITYSGCASWSSVYASKSATWYNSKILPPGSNAIISSPLFHAAALPDLTLAAAAAYCRNPDNDVTGPWCPTSGGTKQYCANPCYLTTCLTDTQGLYYAGTVSVTRLGVPCQAWVSMFPVSHSFATSGWFPDGSAELARNYCRTPDQNRWGPWCYKSNYSGTGSSWDYCNVGYCTGITTAAPTASASTDNCLKSTSGTEYAGTMSTSATGKTCISWTSNTANHPYYLPQMFNAASMTEVSNYCRNPDSSTTGPWCFVDATTRENCNVPMCASTVVTAPGSTDTVMVIVAGILGMVGLTTMLGLAGSLMAAREGPSAVQDGVVPRTASGQQSAAPPPLKAPEDPGIYKTVKTVNTKTTISTTENTDYDEIETQSAPPPPPQQPPGYANGQTTTMMQHTTHQASSSAVKSQERSGGGGGSSDSGYLVHRIVTQPVDTFSGHSAATGRGGGGGVGGSSGGSFGYQMLHTASSGGGGGRVGGGGGHDGWGGGSYQHNYQMEQSGSSGGGGGRVGGGGGSHDGWGGGGGVYLHNYQVEQSGSSGGGGSGGGGYGYEYGQSGYGESRIVGSTGMQSHGGYGMSNSSYESRGGHFAIGSGGGSGGGGGGGRGGGNSSKYTVSVTTRGGGGGGGRTVMSSFSSNHGTSSNGMELRERRGSIVDESLSTFLHGTSGSSEH